MTWTVHCADVLDWCEDYAARIERGEAEPFHAILCDPSYGLGNNPDIEALLTAWMAGDDYDMGPGFMGKDWDTLPGPRYWAALRRVCHPGAYLFAFGGTRTADLLSVAIRLGGWERFDAIDSISWMQGSGFPKSHNIGKAIDREAGAEREVVGKATHIHSRGIATSYPKRPGEKTVEESGRITPQVAEFNITAPATDLAATWEGYGTALKPSHEPILCFRNPKQGTYAANCLSTGAGALNIDQSRVRTGVREIAANLTGQQPDVILSSKNGGQSWGKEQPLCDSCAEDAAKKKKPITQATKVSSAQNNAGQIMNEKDGTPQEDTNKMDTGCLNGQFQAEPNESQRGNTNSSTEESGKMQTDQSQEDTLFTTSMVTSSITDLRTCSLCGAKIMLGNTNGRVDQKHPCTDIEVRQNIDGNTQNTNVNAAQNSGRWPPNVTISHHPGCERLGVNRVGSGKRKEGIARPRRKSWRQMEGRDLSRSPELKGSANAPDNYGTEATDAWACVLACDAPSTGSGRGCGHEWTAEQRGLCPACGGEARWLCPVGELGEQSGERKSGGKNGAGNVSIWGGSDNRQGGYMQSSTGTAARFFPQFSWSYETADRLVQVPPYRYVSKAAQAERDAGLEGFELSEYRTQHVAGGRQRCKNCGGWYPKPMRVQKRPNSTCQCANPDFEDMGEKPVRNHHPCIKPLELLIWLATLILPPAAYAPRRIVIPFGGVMSEACGAVLAGWDEVEAIEKEEEYIPIGKVRLSFWAGWAERGYDDPKAILKAAKREERQREQETAQAQMEMSLCQ